MPSKHKKPAATHVSRPSPIANLPRPATASTSSKTPENGNIQPPTVNGRSLSPQLDSDFRTGDTTESAGEPTLVSNVNRKKQKRREKEAAKRLAEQQLANGHTSDLSRQGEASPPVRQGRGPAKGYFTEEPDYVDDGFHDSLVEPDDAFYSGDEDGQYLQDYEETNNSWLNTSKRKKGPRSRHSGSHASQHAPLRPPLGSARSNLPTLSKAAIRSAHKMSSDRIWNTSTQAERENIKQFWLELGEEERRSLVKVEKEAVLRKMKEQQKHSCSCSVCGRKRTAIEEELEVLYDAYYEELEQFANHNNDLSNGSQVIPSPHSYRTLRGQSHPMAGAYPVSGRIRELGDDGEELDEEDEYDDEDDEDLYSDADYDDELPPGPPDFFQFGNSLTVKDGILTVADDLLKNDGKHFIDMMEQLAERRMQREEEIHYPAPPLAHQGLRQGHNHPPIDDEDEYEDEEDEEEYDSQEEDDFEGDEMDSMTEEQRMEEGRRMFQIFAARMFEQRVLTAYREKVAAERQQKLLEELDEESRLDTQREAKKLKDAAKKKEKKARQKAARDEEKARKDAEKATQEAAVKAAEERKQEEQRKRKEEQRKKREAERKAVEDDRLRKEAEKQRKAHEERERHADNERKQREAKVKREEARKREREEREMKEKEARERRLKEEKERKNQEDLARKQKDEAQKAEKEVKARQEQATKPQPVVLPPGLHSQRANSQIQSPHFQAVTPVVAPTVPTPSRNRQPSQPSQPSHSSSPKSAKASTEASRSSVSPSSAGQSHIQPFIHPAKGQMQGPPLHHPQPSAPRSPLNNLGRGQFPYPMGGMPGLGVNGPPAGPGMIPPGIPHHMPMYPGPPPIGNQQRFGPNGNFPPGFGVPKPFQPGPPIGYQQQPPNPIMPQPPSGSVAKPPPHSRQHSGSEFNHPQAPIARPGPIARPSSTTPDKQIPTPKNLGSDVEHITASLGSKALLDDSDGPIPSNIENRVSLPPVGAPGSGRLPFTSTFVDPKHSNFGMHSPGWSSFGGLHNHNPNSGWSGTAARPSPGWSQQPFSGIGGTPTLARSHAPRPIAVRLMLVHACRRLSSATGGKGDGFHPVVAVLQQLEQHKMPGDPPISMDEMLAICDTEGNIQNGGGSFEVIRDGHGSQLVKHIDENVAASNRVVGDIGGPLPISSPAAAFGSIGEGFGPPGRHF